MRYRNRKPQVRTITVKYAGQCACCGADIPAGAIADYYPAGTIAGRTTGAIAHMGGLDGNSARCAAEIGRRRDPGYVDPGELAEDRWNEQQSPHWR
jgi:hypothetical protein